MESFLTTLPPYVHQYINKHPPTECFNVLKDLICFAVLYSNDREHVNLLSLGLMQKGADRIIVHHPYSSAHLASKQGLRASPIPMDSVVHPLSPTTTIAPGIKSSHSPPPPSLTTNNSNRNSNKKRQHTTIHLNHGCQPVLKEDTAKANATDHTNTTTVSPRTTNTTTVSPKTTNTTTTATKPEDKPLETTRKSTTPSVIPDWLTYPDTETNQVNDVKVTTLPRSESPVPSDRPPMTKAQEMNITNWIPINFTDTTKPTRNQTQRPASVHNPTIPDLRSYPSKPSTPTKKSPQANDTKPSRRLSVPALEPARKPQQQPARSNTSRTPGQTATVRARAEQARQRQWQLEEDKRKAAAAKVPSRTHVRMKQQAVPSMDWDAIKKDHQRRNTTLA